jgi:hypothetical protein
MDADPEVLALVRENYPKWKVLPGGEVAAVAPMTFGNVRLVVGLDRIGYRDGY